MFDLFSGLDVWVGISLVLALTFVLAFEFINGFHDTANAVATVIYTKAMSPYRAVILSGIFNFLGVLLGGVGVAYAIVHLLPVELLINVNTGHGLAMVFSLLAAAITWNLGTWYFGIPASSSHTLIGSILGVGLANALITGVPVADGINWGKAIDIGLSLIFSPLAGFLVAGALLIGLKWLYPLSKMHKTPETRRDVDEKKHPPFWNRLVLVISAMTVSFVHGSNDGQKGIGLIMLVLIGIVPAKFVLDLNSTTYQIERTRDAAIHLQQFYNRHSDTLGEMLALGKASEADLPDLYRCEPKQTEATLKGLLSDLHGVSSYTDLNDDERVQVRRYLLCLDDTAKKVGKLSELPSREGGPGEAAQGPDQHHRVRTFLGDHRRGPGPGHRHHGRLEARGAHRRREDRQAGHDLCPGHRRPAHRDRRHRHGQHLQPAGLHDARAVLGRGGHHGGQPQRPAR